MNLLGWVYLATFALIGIGGFLLKNWVRSNIEKSIQYKFDTKIENVRAEFRESEERLKSDLRLKEAEIAALQDGVLSGRANRQALLDKRRIEAVDRVWSGFVSLSVCANFAASMKVFKIEEVEKVAPSDPRVRKAFQLIGSWAPALPTSPSPAMNERPFVSPLAWAYYSAYSSVVSGAYFQVKAFESGLANMSEIFNHQHIKDLLKAALPHQASLIDQHGSTAGYFLLDELEERLLTELRKMLEGNDLDKADLVQSAEIMKMVKIVNADNAEQLAETREPASADGTV